MNSLLFLLHGVRRDLLCNSLSAPPYICRANLGALAQMGERLICIQEVRSSILLGSTTLQFAKQIEGALVPAGCKWQLNLRSKLNESAYLDHPLGYPYD